MPPGGGAALRSGTDDPRGNASSSSTRSLIEQDLYDKLGVKIETEVIPADAFVAKTLLELNSGSSPWDLVMFGPSNMPDYGRHFEPLEPWIEKMKLDFAMEDIVPVFAKVMLRYQGKLVSMPYDGDIHIMYWNKPAFERPTTARSSRPSTNTICSRRRRGSRGRRRRVLPRLGLTNPGQASAPAPYKPSGGGFVLLVAPRFSRTAASFDANMKP
jgi:hypothetical protein